MKLEEKASQIPNPVLSTRYVTRDEASELEANLSFPIELGGKRGSRRGHANATKLNALALQEVTKSDIKIETVTNLFRLRQLTNEKAVVHESLNAFDKVIGQLKKLPRLSAQQEVSLSLFEIALEEARINESEIFEEERKIEHYFHISTGHSLSEIQAFLPKPKKIWPSVRSVDSKEPSPEIKTLKSLTQLAHQELEIQKSNAWPDIKLGPSLAIEKEGGTNNKMYGLNLQIPLSIFQVNGGGKSFAKSELLRAKKNEQFAKDEEKHERFEQSKVYESAVSILNRTMKQKVVDKKHKRIEKLYLRGVVSSSVFLESIRQKLSYLKSRNRRELTAVKALWNIYKYDGLIFKEQI